MERHQNLYKTLTRVVFFFFGFAFFPNPIAAQLTLDITINSGQVTTTCTDNIGNPDPRFRVSVAGQGLVTYPAPSFVLRIYLIFNTPIPKFVATTFRLLFKSV